MLWLNWFSCTMLSLYVFVFVISSNLIHIRTYKEQSVTEEKKRALQAKWGASCIQDMQGSLRDFKTKRTIQRWVTPLACLHLIRNMLWLEGTTAGDQLLSAWQYSQACHIPSYLQYCQKAGSRACQFHPTWQDKEGCAWRCCWNTGRRLLELTHPSNFTFTPAIYLTVTNQRRVRHTRQSEFRLARYVSTMPWREFTTL